MRANLPYVDSIHPDIPDKMFLAWQSTKTAKQEMVFDNGIGEELPFTLFGWTGDTLAIVCQTGNVYTDKQLRFHGIAHTASVIRKGWGCDALTFVAEGYCVVDINNINTKVPLAEQFANGIEAVAECLTFMHVEQDSLTICALPYKYGLGREVYFGLNIKYALNSDNPMFDFPKRLQRALLNDILPPPEDVETYYETIAAGLTEMGIFCEWWNS